MYRDTFTPVHLIKVLEHAGTLSKVLEHVGTFCEKIETKYRVPEHRPLVFCKFLQYHYFRYGIVFHA